jgi:hypothetical protein
MTQENLEFNKRCALFLGWKETTDEFKINWVGCQTKERLERLSEDYIPILEKNGDVIFPDFSICDFSNDWKLIMDIVIAIENLEVRDSRYASNYSVVIHENSCYIETTGYVSYTVVKEITCTSKKEAVVKAISQFLDLYESK